MNALTYVHITLDNIVDLRIKRLLYANPQQLQCPHGRLGTTTALRVVNAVVTLPNALQHALCHV